MWWWGKGVGRESWWHCHNNVPIDVSNWTKVCCIESATYGDLVCIYIYSIHVDAENYCHTHGLYITIIQTCSDINYWCIIQNICILYTVCQCISYYNSHRSILLYFTISVNAQLQLRLYINKMNLRSLCTSWNTTHIYKYNLYCVCTYLTADRYPNPPRNTNQPTAASAVNTRATCRE